MRAGVDEEGVLEAHAGVLHVGIRSTVIQEAAPLLCTHGYYLWYLLAIQYGICPRVSCLYISQSKI